jgi:RHS repeat-associated protein
MLAATAPPEALVEPQKLALRRSSFPRALAPGLRALQPANTNGESARAYDESVSESCTWTSKDPILFSGGMNLYRYVANDPVNRRDPGGTGWLCDWFGIFCPPDPPPLPSQHPWNPSPCWQCVGDVCNQVCSDGGAGFPLPHDGGPTPPRPPLPPAGGGGGDREFPQCAGLNIFETVSCCKNACQFDPDKPDASQSPPMCGGDPYRSSGRPSTGKECLKRCYNENKVTYFPF